jgi:hypothetical protein
MRMTVIQAYGEIFREDLLELIENPSQDGGFSWLWKRPGQEEVIAQSFRDRRSNRPPIKVDPAILRAVRFPRKPVAYGTGRELLDGIFDLLKKYTYLTELQASVVAFSAIASWVVERSHAPVCLAIIGPPSTERRQLLRMLHCFFHRPLHLAECKLSDILSLPPTLNPTLLIEHCEDLSQLRKIVRTTSSRDAYTISQRRPISAYCAKVVCLNDSWSANFPDWPAIEITLPRADRQLPVLDDRTEEQTAAEYQAKLMMYRTQNYNHQLAAPVDLPQLSPGFREIARSLAPCFSGDRELQDRLMAALHEQDKEVAKPAEQVLLSATLEALLQFCHESRNAKVHVAEIATRFNRILEERGEFLQLHARAMGTLLSKLDFEADGRDAAGHFLLLLQQTAVERIHKLAAEHEMFERNRKSDCDKCEKVRPYDPEIDHEGEIH